MPNPDEAVMAHKTFSKAHRAFAERDAFFSLPNYTIILNEDYQLYKCCANIIVRTKIYDGIIVSVK